MGWLTWNSLTLPLPEGPYVPGAVDVMTGYTCDGCFVRLFYPSSAAHNSKAGWISWIPSDLYLEGFARVLRTWKLALKFILSYYGNEFKVPMMWEAPVLTGSARMPVVVLSHGLGAARFLYSALCAELASQGFVVAVVEHRDGSACATYHYRSPEHAARNEPTLTPYRKVDQGPGHLSARKTQVERRAVECKNVLDLLEDMNAGTASNVLATTFQLDQFKGRLDISNAVMMGHSFGAATALLTLGNEPRFKLGVVMDGWMFPLKGDADLPARVKQPLLFVNTHTFHIPSNVAAMKSFLESSAERQLYTMRKTTHEHQTDTPHFVGLWLNWFMEKLDPVTTHRINNHLILAFLHKHIGLPHWSAKDSFLESQAPNIVENFLLR
ncbi:platelet-activating factor acetylhydrolase-like isoform X2 [Bacillus rossius redtenbacheri]|uniref:platelet-activating factor acetylhydrolase-like isoform X2 n=1 Tax=Bacillus rossius redtenbacheri TaxID=93214 RepID=UPI002FDCBE7A